MAGEKTNPEWFGLVGLKVNGVRHPVVGNATYNLGRLKKEAKNGPDGRHGLKVRGQDARLSCQISDRGDLTVDDILNLSAATVELELRNGKVVVFEEADYVGDGDIETEEGNIQFEISAKSAQEFQGAA
ncbi:MAG: phage tail tube protein [Bdellovibrionota bacterium]